jgi:hypothetical protein
MLLHLIYFVCMRQRYRCSTWCVARPPLSCQPTTTAPLHLLTCSHHLPIISSPQMLLSGMAAPLQDFMQSQNVNDVVSVAAHLNSLPNPCTQPAAPNLHPPVLRAATSPAALPRFVDKVTPQLRHGSPTHIDISPVGQSQQTGQRHEGHMCWSRLARHASSYRLEAMAS